MPQKEDGISQLLKNPENLNLLFELASAHKAQELSSTESQSSAVSPDMQQLLSLLTANRETAHPEPSPPPSQDNNGENQAPANNFSMLSKMLPQLLQIMHGSAEALPSDRVNLVHAIKPYATGKTDHINRAVRMAGIAKAAKSALGALGKQ